ncbi:MurR/RpiR family transcriptional regulator [Rathayibacter sp. VKM Ac-2630]|uniref:MurR/RpiR family transcriptional regulator n=1 Tax=Rathayibacter sp. VKM Ac-2630 TaxID=1938617 RepID=UPI000980D2F0|nr:MurR/RpiR family transcriptional regulator [Rathayibacter sp. VKM Ac-2630]OOB91400.1 MurR/RpiR family transcriptional regulator [Rathayibacter sp. VKM Ac-2630]
MPTPEPRPTTATTGDSTLLAQLRAASGRLGPSERRVARVVLSRPEDVVDWSTTELATAAETSAATVIRACQSLGFRGFQHLRLELARSTPRTGVDAAASDGGVRTVFDDAVAALRLAREGVDPEAVGRAVDLLATAHRLVLVGNGFSGPPLQDAALRLSTLGRSVEAPADVLAQQFAAHALEPGDVCLAVSYSGANAHTLAACRAAADRGADVLAITSFARAPLARLATVALISSPTGDGHGVDPFLSRLNQTVLLHVLHSQLARRLAPTGAGMRDVVAEALTDEI